MSQKKNNIMISENPVLGFRPADLFGILIMVIPFVISIEWKEEIPVTYLWGLIDSGRTKTIAIAPYAVTTAIAVVFYLALVLRFNFFKANNLAQAIISSIRTFLDCWVLAAILSFAIPREEAKAYTLAAAFQNTKAMLLFFAVALTWLGMKTIAGYSWILFLIAAWSNVVNTSNAMGEMGAVFVLTAAISLMLQVKDVASAKDFLQEFRIGTSTYTAQVKNSINRAAYDATKKVYVVSNVVRQQIGEPVIRVTPAPTQAMPTKESVKVNFEALDINKDGVVDEKDFLMMQKNTKSDN